MEITEVFFKSLLQNTWSILTKLRQEAPGGEDKNLFESRVQEKMPAKKRKKKFQQR